MGYSARPEADEFFAAVRTAEQRLTVLERCPTGLKTIGPSQLAVIPAVRVQKSANQTVAGTGASAGLTWQTVARDTAGMFNAGSPTVITVPINGIYLVETMVSWAASATSYRITQFVKNGGNSFMTTAISPIIVATILTTANQAATVELVAGDQISCAVSQATGANLDVLGGINGLTYLAITWLGNV